MMTMKSIILVVVLAAWSSSHPVGNEAEVRQPVSRLAQERNLLGVTGWWVDYLRPTDYVLYREIIWRPAVQGIAHFVEVEYIAPENTLTTKYSVQTIMGQPLLNVHTSFSMNSFNASLTSPIGQPLHCTVEVIGRQE